MGTKILIYFCPSPSLCPLSVSILLEVVIPAAGYLYLELLNATDRRNILWVDDFGRIGGLLGDPGAVDMVRRTRFGLGLRF